MVASLPTTNAVAAPKPKMASWIVVLKDGNDPGAVAKSVGATSTERYSNVFSGFAADLTDAQRARLDADSRVVSLAENWVMAQRPEPPDDVIPPGQGPQFVTNGVRRIGGLLSPTAHIDGHSDPMDVDVAVIDDGVFNHLDLNLYKQKSCVRGKNFSETVVEGHGTLVAGFVGARDNAFGAVGVAPGARIWSVSVFNPESGDITLESVLCGPGLLKLRRAAK